MWQAQSKQLTARLLAEHMQAPLPLAEHNVRTATIGWADVSTATIGWADVGINANGCRTVNKKVNHLLVN